MSTKDIPVQGDPYHDFQLVHASKAVDHDSQLNNESPGMMHDLQIIGATPLKQRAESSYIPKDSHPLIQKQPIATEKPLPRDNRADKMHITISPRETVQSYTKTVDSLRASIAAGVPEIIITEEDVKKFWGKTEEAHTLSPGQMAQEVQKGNKNRLDKIVHAIETDKNPPPQKQQQSQTVEREQARLKAIADAIRNSPRPVQKQSSEEKENLRERHDYRMVNEGAEWQQSSRLDGTSGPNILFPTPEQEAAAGKEMEKAGHVFKPRPEIENTRNESDTLESKKTERTDDQDAVKNGEQPKTNEKKHRRKGAGSIIKQLTTRARNLFRPAYSSYEAHYPLASLQETDDHSSVVPQTTTKSPAQPPSRDAASVYAEAAKNFGNQYERSVDPLQSDTEFQQAASKLLELQKKRTIKGEDEIALIENISTLLTQCEDINERLGTISEFKDEAPHTIALAEAILGHGENGISKFLRNRAEGVIKSLDDRNRESVKSNDRSLITERVKMLLSSTNRSDAYRNLVLSFLNDKDLHPTHLATILGIPQARQVVMDVLEIGKRKEDLQSSPQAPPESDSQKKK